ncbi:MAG: hypothetical protein KGO81_05985 [Bacteroidota bacterium]|nr:hypothetical protein [Bacteroidota bacterium]
MFEYNKKYPPFQIYTTWLSIGELHIFYEKDLVLLWGCYGDLVTNDVKCIELETTFDMLSDLLDIACREYEEDTQEVIRVIANTMANCKDEECTVIDIGELGGLNIEDQIFALTLLFESLEPKDLELKEHGEEPEANEESEETDDEPEQPRYAISGLFPNKNLLPSFYDYENPERPIDKPLLYNQLLAIRFYFYLLCKAAMPDNQARHYSGLTDTLIYTLSEIQYNALDGFNDEEEEE